MVKCSKKPQCPPKKLTRSSYPSTAGDLNWQKRKRLWPLQKRKWGSGLNPPVDGDLKSTGGYLVFRGVVAGRLALVSAGSPGAVVVAEAVRRKLLGLLGAGWAALVLARSSRPATAATTAALLEPEAPAGLLRGEGDRSLEAMAAMVAASGRLSHIRSASSPISCKVAKSLALRTSLITLGILMMNPHLR